MSPDGVTSSNAVQFAHGARALSLLLYPTLVVGAPLAALALRPYGDSLALGVPQLVVLAIVFSLERAIPFERAWKRTRRDLLVDVLHALLSTSLVAAVVQGLASDRLGAWASALGAPWPTTWPLAVQVLVAILLGELGNYWLHRQGTTHAAICGRSRRPFRISAAGLSTGDIRSTSTATSRG